MPAYPIPPWIAQPADPAAHYAQGFQIGSRIGAEQAAQQFQQQQMLRQQQQDAYEQQYKNTVLQMQVDAATRKHQAINAYTQLVQSGVPSIDAMKQVGPDLGYNPAALAQAEMMSNFRQQQLAETAKYHAAQAAKRSPALLEAEDLANEREKLNSLPEGSPERDRQQAIVDSMEARHNQQEIEVTSLPGGGTTTRIGKASKKGPQTLTTAEETRLGEDIQASANALRVLNSLQKQVDSNAVGIGPMLGSAVLDRVLGQFDKDLVNQKRVEARQNIGIATQQVLGELNNRGRFSNMELTAIKSLMPGLGAAESPERSRIAVLGLRKVLAEKGAHAAVSLKRDVPAEILTTLSEQSDKQLADEVKAGALDKDIFWKVFEFKHGKAK
jgi:hypothetical protein